MLNHLPVIEKKSSSSLTSKKLIISGLLACTLFLAAAITLVSLQHFKIGSPAALTLASQIIMPLVGVIGILGITATLIGCIKQCNQPKKSKDIELQEYNPRTTPKTEKDFATKMSVINTSAHTATENNSNNNHIASKPIFKPAPSMEEIITLFNTEMNKTVSPSNS